MAAFTAPTYMQSDTPDPATSDSSDSSGTSALDDTRSWLQQHFPGLFGGGNSTTPAAPAPTDTASQDAALVQKLNLPTGWSVVSHAPGAWTDAKGVTQGAGTTVLTLAGPNGQPGTVVVDSQGNVTPDGTLKVGTAPTDTAASKVPTPPDQWVTITDGQGNPIARQDPKTGASVNIPKPATPAPRSTVVSAPPTDQNIVTATTQPDGTVKIDSTPNPNAQSTQTLTAAQQSQADYQKQDIALRAQVAAATAANDAAQQKLDQAKLTWDQQSKQLDDDLANKKLDLDQYTAQYTQAHQAAQDAQAQADLAQQKVRDAQTAQTQTAQVANQTAQTNETARHNQVTEGQDATKLANDQTNSAFTNQLNNLQLQQKTLADQQTSDRNGAQIGAGLLQNRVSAASGLLDNTLGHAISAPHLGLGSQLGGGWGAGLVNGITNWTTQLGGGQGVYDAAANMVKQANPALSNTNQGQQITAQLADMLQKYQQVVGQPHPAVGNQNANTAAAPAFTAPSTTPTPAPVPVVSPGPVSMINQGQATPMTQFTPPGADYSYPTSPWDATGATQ